MAFKAKLAIAFFVLLYFLGTASSKKRVLRREKDDPDVHEHEGAGRKPAPPPPKEGDEEPQKRVGQKKKVFVRIAPKPFKDFLLPSDTANAGRGNNVELVRASLTFQEESQHQFAAIWIDTSENNNFAYIPNQEGGPQDAGGVEYPCGPPVPSEGPENYLVARVHSEGAQGQEKTKYHAEEILHHQVTVHGDLKRYADTVTGQVKRIWMYSLNHPCEKCGPKLVTICNQIKTAFGFRGNCDVIFSHHFKLEATSNYQTADDEVRDAMQKDGLVVYKLQRG